MIRPICRDLLILSQKTRVATAADRDVAQDLMDTLAANADRCVGMAANMIGVPVAVIVVSMGLYNMAMMNPVIVERSGGYQTEEGCLSLDGVRQCTRYSEITVKYEDINFKKHKGKYSGLVAEIIQHECDHLEGRII